MLPESLQQYTIDHLVQTFILLAKNVNLSNTIIMSVLLNIMVLLEYLKQTFRKKLDLMLSYQSYFNNLP